MPAHLIGGRESYEMPRDRLLPALPRDGNLQEITTPCMRHPQDWDHGANAAIKRTSAVICREQCPCLTVCEAMIPFAAGGSVVAGRVLPVWKPKRT